MTCDIDIKGGERMQVWEGKWNFSRLTSRGWNIHRSSDEWVKNPKHCGSDIFCNFSLFYSKAHRLHNSAEIISVVQQLLMKFRLLNKLKVKKMSSETVRWPLMPSHLKGMWSELSWFLSMPLYLLTSISDTAKYPWHGQSFLVIICEMQLP